MKPSVLSVAPSVYCTLKSKCNMILKHATGKPFTLNSIIIKAPAAGFTCPVQQGSNHFIDYNIELLF